MVLMPEPHDAGRTSLREFLHPQIGRPLGRVFTLADDAWPERVITADLLHEELGAGGVHLVTEDSDPIRTLVSVSCGESGPHSSVSTGRHHGAFYGRGNPRQPFR